MLKGPSLSGIFIEGRGINGRDSAGSPGQRAIDSGLTVSNRIAPWLPESGLGRSSRRFAPTHLMVVVPHAEHEPQLGVVIAESAVGGGFQALAGAARIITSGGGETEQAEQLSASPVLRRDGCSPPALDQLPRLPR